jgi:hypothetical protein
MLLTCALYLWDEGVNEKRTSGFLPFFLSPPALLVQKP